MDTGGPIARGHDGYKQTLSSGYPPGWWTGYANVFFPPGHTKTGSFLIPAPAASIVGVADRLLVLGCAMPGSCAFPRLPQAGGERVLVGELVYEIASVRAQAKVRVGGK